MVDMLLHLIFALTLVSRSVQQSSTGTSGTSQLRFTNSSSVKLTTTVPPSQCTGCLIDWGAVLDGWTLDSSVVATETLVISNVNGTNITSTAVVPIYDTQTLFKDATTFSGPSTWYSTSYLTVFDQGTVFQIYTFVDTVTTPPQTPYTTVTIPTTVRNETVVTWTDESATSYITYPTRWLLLDKTPDGMDSALFTSSWSGTSDACFTYIGDRFDGPYVLAPDQQTVAATTLPEWLAPYSAFYYRGNSTLPLSLQVLTWTDYTTTDLAASSRDASSSQSFINAIMTAFGLGACVSLSISPRGIPTSNGIAFALTATTTTYLGSVGAAVPAPASSAEVPTGPATAGPSTTARAVTTTRPRPSATIGAPSTASSTPRAQASSARPSQSPEGQTSALPVPVTVPSTVRLSRGTPVVPQPQSTSRPAQPQPVSANTVVLGSSASFVVVNGHTSSLAPAGTKPPAIIIGSSTIQPNSRTEYVVGTQTLRPGEAITITGGVQAAGTQPSPPPPTTPPTLIIAGSTVLPDSATHYIIGSQTLTPGGAITISGTQYSLGSSATQLVIGGTFTENLAPSANPPTLTIDGSTFTANSATQFIIDGQTLTPGGVITIHNTPFSLAEGATALIVGSTFTSTLPSYSSSVPTLVIGGSTFTANSATQFIIDGQTLTPGGVITVSGSEISLAPSATALVFGGSSTEPLGPLSTSGSVGIGACILGGLNGGGCGATGTTGSSGITGLGGSSDVVTGTRSAGFTGSVSVYTAGAGRSVEARESGVLYVLVGVIGFLGL